MICFETKLSQSEIEERLNDPREQFTLAKDNGKLYTAKIKLNENKIHIKMNYVNYTDGFVFKGKIDNTNENIRIYGKNCFDLKTKIVCALPLLVEAWIYIVYVINPGSDFLRGVDGAGFSKITIVEYPTAGFAMWIAIFIVLTGVFYNLKLDSYKQFVKSFAKMIEAERYWKE